MSYFEYRHKIQQISIKNFKKLNATILPGLNSMKRVKELKNIVSQYKDVFILPTDDDDWYSPEIKNINKPGLHYWITPRFINVEEFMAKPEWAEQKGVFPASNGYGFTKDIILELNNEQVYELLFYHIRVFELVKERIKHEKCLSIWNRHPGTAFLLTKEFQSRKIIKKRKEVILPQKYKWAKDEINETRKLIESIKVKNIKKLF